ncbi:membrane cofactor protein-like isoform X1 [Sagmatias obliquidens]|uniref:membrane cofactor protein-like isoform X1 n=1 Tax=Sagmatias obliquidens TaxID=3371155 RepID=UPI000F440D18|nr:membrane cofactor protein-like isoform X1 [Lagenorhynchus obliquidens]
MTAPCSSRKASPYRSESPFSSRCFVGILLVALLLLLPISSDACGEPPRYESMRLPGVPKPSYSPGESVQYECRLGYQPKRPPLPTSAVCQNDGMWSLLQEACTRKQCPNLGDPPNGQVDYPNGSILFGSEAHYVCNVGYFLIGPSILYCDISGSTVDWSDTPPMCEKILCKPPEKILNGKYTNSHKDIFEYSEVVTYSCDASNGTDQYSLVGESKLVCIGNDKWSSDPPQCKGYPSPSDEPPPKDAESLGAGIIVAIVIGTLFGIVVVCSIYFGFHKEKKRKEGIATYSACQDKATTPAQQMD